MDTKYQVVIINRPEDTTRLDNMIIRMHFHYLSEFVHIIPADDNNDEFRNFIKEVEDKCDSRQIKVLGSLLCHLKAMKYFIEESSCDECLILEDDAMLIKDFRSNLAKIIKSKPTDHQCILLSPYLTQGLEYKERVSDYLFNHYSQSIFGASSYWITKDFARKALERYGKPLREWNNFTPCFTSESLINNIGAYVAYPALGIEESVDTNLQVSIFGKKDYWERYGYENFF
jgi:GR25 family glycosyltransferase involved in LPS biosynthesis